MIFLPPPAGSSSLFAVASSAYKTTVFVAHVSVAASYCLIFKSAPVFTEVVFCQTEPVGLEAVSVVFQRGRFVCFCCTKSGA